MSEPWVVTRFEATGSFELTANGLGIVPDRCGSVLMRRQHLAGGAGVRGKSEEPAGRRRYRNARIAALGLPGN